MNKSDTTEPQAPGERAIPLPTRVTVSLRAGFVLAVANIICVAIIAWAYTSAQAKDQVITVTGSAKKRITSDLITWECTISANSRNAVEAYDTLKESVDRTSSYLIGKGIPKDQIKLSPVLTSKNFLRDSKGNATDEVTSVDLRQSIQVRSSDVARVAEVASDASSLLKEGIMIDSRPPGYLYTRLADLKVEMLAEATKDATARAKQIADNSGARFGSIRDARMGVMQINALNSDEVTGGGVNDTTSLEKEITAVVSAKFALK